MALTVRLAGYNLDADLLTGVIDLLSRIEQGSAELESGGFQTQDCKQLIATISETIRTNLDPASFTPETISAAYARISRDPKAVTEQRRAARFGVTRARKSNENIIFGLGHASVAEHACFNFDILGLSRLASEELQSHRLLSFTEKSQRYITLTTDYVIPPEVAGTEWEADFHETVPTLFAGYQGLCDVLIRRLLGRKSPEEATKDELKDAENRAKEDARYLLPLASATQMGMTLNARMVEHIVRDLSDHPLAELRDLSRKLYDAVRSLAPSVVKYVVRETYPRMNRRKLAELLPEPQGMAPAETVSAPTVRLLDKTPNGELAVLRALAFTGGSDGEAANAISVWLEIFRGMRTHDGTLREFEMADLTFEADISASCFAQLKRHRMMTMLAAPHSLTSGAIIPPSLIEAGLEQPFADALETSRRAAQRIAAHDARLAPYFLTNAQRRKVILRLNARELYHLIRLRADRHAQWEIRSMALQMLSLAREAWPNLMMLACGKDRFEDVYGDLFGGD